MNPVLLIPEALDAIMAHNPKAVITTTRQEGLEDPVTSRDLNSAWDIAVTDEYIREFSPTQMDNSEATLPPLAERCWGTVALSLGEFTYTGSDGEEHTVDVRKNLLRRTGGFFSASGSYNKWLSTNEEYDGKCFLVTPDGSLRERNRHEESDRFLDDGALAYGDNVEKKLGIEERKFDKLERTAKRLDPARKKELEEKAEQRREEIRGRIEKRLENPER